jgi:NAD(P)H-hydrate epimerase
MLSELQYHVEVFLFNTKGELSEDCQTNLGRLKECGSVYFTEVSTRFDPPTLTEQHLVIDGLFGSGLNKPLSGGFAAVVKYINSSKAQVVSIDIPSGLMGEDNTYNVRQHLVHADVTLSIQLPKLAFLFPENEGVVGEWELLPIGLRQDYIDEAPTPYYITEEADIIKLIRPRKRFAHKGNFGRGLLIAGSYGMAGASILSARGCLRSGIGVLTVHTPISNHNLVQIAVPEAIVHTDIHDRYFAEPVDLDRFQAVAIGPGLGQEEDTALALLEQIQMCSVPLVIDADALNILSTRRAWLSKLPKHSILTPHIGELERLIGKCMDTYERISKTKELAAFLQSYIILKGAWTAVITPEGNVYFNPTGNPGMATAGSGDVLTGVLLSLLSQGYSQEDACRLGVYAHGLAGDIAAEELGETGMTAGDIVEALPKAWKRLSQK